MRYRERQEDDFEEFYLDEDYDDGYTNDFAENDHREDSLYRSANRRETHINGRTEKSQNRDRYRQEKEGRRIASEWEEDEDLDEIQRMRSRKKQPSRRRGDYQERTETSRGNRKASPSGGSPRGRKTGRKNKKRKILITVLIVIAALIGFLFFQRWWKTRDGYWNIAVFGVDSRSGNLEKGALSDVEIICSINKKTKEARLISVYRDTYLQIDEDGSYDKINEAYFLGGHEQAIAALERNLDIQIDDYATFNWKAVADAINLLGGIDLEITDAEFAQINSFITETVNSTGIGSYQLEHAGMNHLDGVQAVAYSRLRLMDTDFNRTERQRKVVQLALEKAKQADAATLTSIIMSVLPQLSTSIGAEDLIPIAKDISKYEIGMTAGFPFAKTTTRINKKDCVIPMTLESNVAALHNFLYGDAAAGYTVPSSVREISNHISEVSGIYEEGEIPGFVYEGSPEKGSSDGGGQSENTVQETVAKTEPAEQPAETSAETESETVAESSEESTEESTEESQEESTEENTEETEEETDASEGPVSPMAPEQTQPDGPGASTEPAEEGPGAGLPAPGESEQSGPGIIHSGTSDGESSPSSESENVGPGVSDAPLYTGPGQSS